jgi:hypothetical protein
MSHHKQTGGFCRIAGKAKVLLAANLNSHVAAGFIISPANVHYVWQYDASITSFEIFFELISIIGNRRQEQT